MMIVYTDANRNDVGVLTDYYLDQEDSSDAERNTFQLIVRKGKYPGLTVGSFVYCEGTEIGGRIDSIKTSTDSNSLSLEGRTWRGILASKIIQPPAGADYYTDNTTTSGLVSNVVNAVGLATIFEKGAAGTTKFASQFDRYTDALSGLNKVLEAQGYKLVLKYDGNIKKIVYDEVLIPETDVISELYDFTMTYSKGVNHLIALGSGQLKNRQVFHLYVNESGNMSQSQAYTGIDEVMAVLDYPAAESLAELQTAARSKLRELSASSGISITSKNLEAELGDVLVCRAWLPDPTTGEDVEYVVKQPVRSKITTIKNDIARYQYKLGA